MKNSIIRLTAICALSILSLASVSAQTKSAAKTKEQSKAIAQEKVPTIVKQEFVREYPLVDYNTWYGYPTFRVANEWYDYNPMYYTYEYPEYYVVDFATDKAVHKAVYTKEGKKVTIHHNLKVESQPAAISAALKSGIYKTWKETEVKEEIENVTTKEKVYKITLEKDGKKHFIYYDADGKLIKGHDVNKI